MLNVKDYGCVGDGVTDDTDSFIHACETALGIGAGTLETGGDEYLAYGSSNRQPVYLPPGEYRFTRAIPVRYVDLSIIGDPILPWVTSFGSRILVDHAGDGFHINMNHGARHFQLRFVQMTKPAKYRGSGSAIRQSATRGEGYNWGPIVEYCSIRGFDYGVRLQKAAGQVTVGAQVRIRSNHIATNNHGVVSDGLIIIGEICSNNLSQNTNGGIAVSGQDLVIADNDLEGQANPLSVSGNALSRAVSIERNYFEGVSKGSACIVVQTCIGFSILNNHISTGVGIAPVQCGNCHDGEVDQNARLIGCHNVRVRGGHWLSPTTDASNISFNLRKWEPPRTLPNPGASVTVREASYGSVVNMAVGNDVFDAQKVTTNVSRAGLSVKAGEYLYIALAIRYPNDAPTINPDIVAPVGSWGIADVAVADIRAGDTIVGIVQLKNTTRATQSPGNVSIHPYGVGRTGAGAEVSSLIMWVDRARDLPAVSPLGWLPKGKKSTAHLAGVVLGEDSGRVELSRQASIEVSAPPVTIATLPDPFGTMSHAQVLLVVGNARGGGNSFADLVLWATHSGATVISSRTTGSPAARTYGISANVNLQLAIATGTYQVGVVRLSTGYYE